jgi:translation initiation factor 1
MGNMKGLGGLGQLGALVYSSDQGRMCPGCRQPVASCECAARRASEARAVRGLRDAMVRVSREKAGRGGKTVTVVRGLALDEVALAALSKQLKTACGSGGTVRDGVIEVQGDHADRVLALLVQTGHKAKRSGG